MADGIKIDVTVNGAQAESAIKSLEKTIKGFAQNSEKQISKATSAMDVFKGAFAANIATKGLELAASAVSGLVGFMEQSISKAKEQEDAINTLNVALERSGQFSLNAAQGFIAWADSLENASRFSGETIQTNAAMLQSMANLSEGGLKQATQAAIELATTFNIDLETATRAVGKAANGEVGALKKFGVEVAKGKTDAESFANALAKLGSFSGNAEASLNTFSGAQIRLNNSFDSVQKTLGRVITQNPAIIAAFKLVGDAVNQLGSFLDANKEEIRSFIEAGIFLFIDALRVTLEVLDIFHRTGVVAFNAIMVAGQGMAAGVVGALALVEEAIRKIASFIPGLSSIISNETNVMGGLFKTLSESINEDIADINNAVSNTSGFSSAADAIQGASEKIQQALDNEGNAAIASAEKFKMSAEAKRAAAGGGEIDPQIQKDIDAEKQKQVEIAAIRKQAALEQEEFEIQKRILAEEQTAIDMERLREIELEKAMIPLEAEEQKNALLDESRAKRAEAEKIAVQKELTFQKTANEQKLKAEKDLQLKQQQTQKVHLDATANFIQAGLLLAKEGSRAQKALSIAAATVSTYQAAAQALTAPPGPPVTYPLVASTIALGLAQVAKITSTGSFQDGGFVGASPATPLRGDNVLARVNPGEFIANRQQQQNIIQAIANGGEIGGGSSIREVIGELMSAVLNQPVIVSIDGREVARATRNQIQNGFRLA